MYIPSLRERKDDIPVLVKHFLEICSERENKNFGPISEDIINVLSEYSWPGNIRELENIVERAVILGKEPELKLSDFSINKGFQQQQTLLSTPTIETRINEQAVTSLRDIEYKNLMDALQKTSGNISKTAKILGVSRDTLYRKMKKYGIGLKN